MSWLAACWLLAPPLLAAGSPLPVRDAELREAIRLVEDGDYASGLRALDALLRRLEREPGRRSERATAHLYAGVALVAQGKTGPARERFRRALAEDPAFTVSAEQFPPKVTELLAAARADVGPSASATARLRLIRSTSGASGAMRGSAFVVDDARSSFHVPADREVVVYFEWEAGPGVYRLQGAWLDPQGRHVTQSEIVVENRGPRVGAYWRLALPASVLPGQWTLEISEDDRTVGQHAIQVLAPPGVREAESEPDELYTKVRPSLTTIEKRDGRGQVFGRGLGFFVGPGRVATAFQVVDGARSLQLRLSDGRSVACERVAAWNRWEDWALLEIPAAGLAGLRLLEKPLEEDQRYRVFDLDADGNPYLARPLVALPTTVEGKARERLTLGWAGNFTDAGFRLVLAREAAGGPVLDARGRVAGIVGGSLVPGEVSADGLLSLSASMATPASLVVTPREATATLAELITSGESLEPSRPGELRRAVLARSTEASGPDSVPADETTEFLRSHGQIWVWALFEPRKARKVSLGARIYDLDGVLLAEGDPVQKEFAPGRPQTASWHIGLSRLRAGVHRVDVLLESERVWRGYFRLSE